MCFSRLTNGVIKMSFCTRIESLPAKCCFQVRWEEYSDLRCEVTGKVTRSDVATNAVKRF